MFSIPLMTTYNFNIDTIELLMRFLALCLTVIGIIWSGMTIAAKPSMPVEVIFNDSIEDNNFSSRGWYDNTNLVLSNDGAYAGSSHSIEYQFSQGATKPVNGSAMRRKFTPSNSVYVSYYVKYSDNWVGSEQSYHPHEFQLLTNENSDYVGPAYTNLTAYVEQNELNPRLAIQDGMNVDTSNIGVNLVGVTENRAVAGCNGDSDDYGDGSCYRVGSGNYWNGKFYDSTYTITKDEWHRIEVFFKLNTIIDNEGQKDGVMRYWLDGQLLIELSDVVFRTGRYPNMLFNQIVIAPYIGDGSPVLQTMWIDDLTVATENLNATIPNPPSFLLVD